jgi:hypothetical protein
MDIQIGEIIKMMVYTIKPRVYKKMQEVLDLMGTKLYRLRGWIRGAGILVPTVSNLESKQIDTRVFQHLLSRGWIMPGEEIPEAGPGVFWYQLTESGRAELSSGIKIGELPNPIKAARPRHRINYKKIWIQIQDIHMNLDNQKLPEHITRELNVRLDALYGYLNTNGQIPENEKNNKRYIPETYKREN